MIIPCDSSLVYIYNDSNVTKVIVHWGEITYGVVVTKAIGHWGDMTYGVIQPNN